MFRTKESKLILLLCILMVVTVGGLFYRFYMDNSRYEEQTSMAKKYLQEGDYKQAITYFEKALLKQDGDKEGLSIGLAEAYIGNHEYDKALEALRSYYQTSSSLRVKEKIEDVTVLKNEYEYITIINRAEKYFFNEDYEKSVSEYEKAKLIKSKEPLSYQRIAESYIKLEQYALAREEVEEGIAITQNENLNDIMNTADRFLIQEQYHMIIESAKEYIYQENYEDGIKKYKEAIKVYPQGKEAYINLATVYMTQKEYNQAIGAANRGLDMVHSEELEELLGKATKSKELEKRTQEELTNLSNCLDTRDIIDTSILLKSEFFVHEILPKAPIYYTIRKGNAFYDAKELVIYDVNHIYYGHRKEDEKVGNGVYLYLQDNVDIAEYFLYSGEWGRNKPDGKGILEEGTIQVSGHNKLITCVVTEGDFMNGVEHGKMEKTFYSEGEQTGIVTYESKYGVPLLLEDEDLEEAAYKDTYPIGVYFKEDGSSEHYYVHRNTYWSINMGKIK